MKASYRFFQNRACKFFPCHEKLKEEDFNCLFCYCPLYMLGEECGGNFSYVKGVKSCLHCTLPHHPKGYDIVNKRLGDYIKREAEKKNERKN